MYQHPVKLHPQQGKCTTKWSFTIALIAVAVTIFTSRLNYSRVSCCIIMLPEWASCRNLHPIFSKGQFSFVMKYLQHLTFFIMCILLCLLSLHSSWNVLLHLSHWNLFFSPCVSSRWFSSSKTCSNGIWQNEHFFLVASTHVSILDLTVSFLDASLVSKTILV